MKFISEKSASKASPNKVIVYITNSEKCVKSGEGILMRTVGLDDTRPYNQQFRDTAELAGNPYNTNSRKYYHFKYTVSPEDYAPERGICRISPEQLLDETEKLVLERFDGYQCIATIQYHSNGLLEERANRPHLHAHLLVNAYSYIPGQHKLDLSPRDLDDLRDYAYESGKKYNLTERYWRDEVKAKRQKQKQSHTKSINISEGELDIIAKHGTDFADHAWKEQCRIAIDEARGETTCLALFILYLLEVLRIRVRITESERISFKFPGRQNYISGERLGTDYTLSAISSSLKKTKSQSDYYLPTRRCWSIQRQLDSIRVARELGANTPAEFELLVRQEGKKYGNAKREYQVAKREYNSAIQNGTNEEISKAMTVLQIKKECFEQEKAHYISCARALEADRMVAAANATYSSAIPPSVSFIPEPEAHRSKEEAEKERLRQWTDLRKWSDEASTEAAMQSGDDLQAWATRMETYGCRIRITENTISIQHPDSKQAVRSNRLGGAYTKEEIINGIYLQRQRIQQEQSRCTEQSRKSDRNRSRGIDR